MLKRIANKIEKTSYLYFFTILFIVGFFTYSASLFNDFVWDDEEQIQNNFFVQDIENIPYLFTGSTFNSGGGGLEGIYYKPLMPTFFAINYAIWGENSFGFHLFSVFLHLINSILAFYLFLFLFKKFKYKNLLSIVLSLIFLVHPTNAESVAYIASTQELLYVFFLLMSLLTAISWINSSSKNFLKFCLINIFILCSLLSKDSGIVSIPIVGFFVFVFAKKRFWKIFTSVSLTYLFYLFLRLFIAKVSYFYHFIISPIAQASLTERLINIPFELFSYLRLFVFPMDLFIAQHKVVTSMTDSRFYLYLPIVFAIFIFLIVNLRKKSKSYLFFFFWTIISFSILLNIFILDMTVAERWMYGPLIGLLGLLGAIIKKLKEKNFLMFTMFLIIIIPFFCIRTFDRTLDWKDNLTLFAHDEEFSQDSFDLQNNLGVALFRLGKVNEAKVHFEKSVRLAPNWWTNYNNLGVIYQNEGNIDQAKKLYEKAIKNGKHYLAYENLVRIKVLTEEPKDVLLFTEDALEILPYNMTLNKTAAIIAFQIGDLEKAKFYAKKTYSIQPSKENYTLLMQVLNYENPSK